MAKQKYQLKPEDVRHSQRWIWERVIKKYWPNGITAEAFEKFPGPNEETTAKKLQKWCDRHLAPEYWRRLQNALRQHRRDFSEYRTVRLTADAHHILSELAKRDKLTISEAIERHYSGFLDSPAKHTSGNSIAAQHRRHAASGCETGATAYAEQRRLDCISRGR